MNFFIRVIILLCVVSCASRHQLMNGTVALKIDENSGIACIESNVARPGTRLKLMNNDCSTQNIPDRRAGCQLVEAGEIEVTKILNEHYVEFKKLSGPGFDEGSIIAKPK